MARGYGSFSIWYSNKQYQKRNAKMQINMMSGRDFYDSFSGIRHLIRNKSILRRLNYLDNVYGKKEEF